MPEGPLSGITVVECSIWMLGPLAGAMLGDLGADVIKIENPHSPDGSRNLVSVAAWDLELPGGKSSMFEAANRNKRGVGIDLKANGGPELVKELARDADVFIENFRPGALARLGLSYEELKNVNPRIIYGRASGHGFKGPEFGRPAIDGLGQSRSGLMWQNGRAGDPPNWNTIAMADVMGANMLAYGVVTALAARERTGVGQQVEISHIMASIWLQYWAVSACMLRDLPEWARFDRDNAANPLYNLYRCADSEWIFIGCVNAERDWHPLCRALDMDSTVRDDPRFQTFEGIRTHNTELIQILERQFDTRPRAVWENRLRQEPDLVFDRVQRIRDLPNDPAVQANDYLIEIDNPAYGKRLLPNHPVIFSETPASIRRPPPGVGEHTAEVLRERLGLDDERIAELVIKGIIG